MALLLQQKPSSTHGGTAATGTVVACADAELKYPFNLGSSSSSNNGKGKPSMGSHHNGIESGTCSDCSCHSTDDDDDIINDNDDDATVKSTSFSDSDSDSDYDCDLEDCSIGDSASTISQNSQNEESSIGEMERYLGMNMELSTQKQQQKQRPLVIPTDPPAPLNDLHNDLHDLNDLSDEPPYITEEPPAFAPFPQQDNCHSLSFSVVEGPRPSLEVVPTKDLDLVSLGDGRFGGISLRWID